MSSEKISGGSDWLLEKGVVNAIRLAAEFGKGYLIMSIFANVLQGMVPAGSVIIMQEITKLVQSREEDFRVITAYAVGLAGLHMLGAVIDLLYSRYKSPFRLRFTERIGVRMMKKAQQLSLSDFETSETFAVISRARNQDGEDIPDCVDAVSGILKRIVSIAGMIGILMGFDWRIAAVILMSLIGRGSASLFIGKEMYGARPNRPELRHRERDIRSMAMTARGYKDIKVLGIGTDLSGRYEDTLKKIISQENRMCRKGLLPGVCLDFLGWMIAGGIWGYVIYSGFAGRILAGDVMVYIICTERIMSLAEQGILVICELAGKAGGIKALTEYLNLPEAAYINRKEVLAIRSIEFCHVSFRYPNGMYALKNVSFSIRQGEAVALAGEDGAGKSTLIKLLLGLYDEYDGEIFVNDVNLREIAVDSYRKKISAVFQESYKYEASLRENTAIGRCPGGQQFSEKEWERLAIARAFLRDADVYIFDEPDGAEEVFSQQEFVRLLKKKKEHKIMICALHASEISGELTWPADQIMVMREGMVVSCRKGSNLQEGTPSER
ncbi:MAG: ABC transporter ATP-binding protein [Dorea sp.]|nr:ABC transporter ATP-binding protein [Dorea sp.]